MAELKFPEVIESEEQLDALLAQPQAALIEFMRGLDGDLMILGVAGKMGVSLAHLAIHAIQAGGLKKNVFGVARFSNPQARKQLESIGVQTIACDLLDRSAVDALPPVPNIVFMAGRKFGTAGAKSLTWAMNTLVPGNVGEHFRSSRIVVFSTGCVYPLALPGEAPDESVTPDPIGEYAQSCLGRERVFEYYSESFGTSVCLFRLNYAIDLRYGVLHDIAEEISRNQPVNPNVGSFNVIWQGDANHQALMSLGQCTAPANILNITGPETLSTEKVAQQIAQRMGKPVEFSTTSASSSSANPASNRSYLNDSQKAAGLFGRPTVSADQLIRWQSHWMTIGGRSLGKPTHFEVNDGAY